MHFESSHIKTLIIKIGTSLLSGKRAFEGHVMEAMVREICALKAAHTMNVLIVSSGAVGCGMNTLGYTKRPTSLPIKQAVAAVGQATLVHYYETLFQSYSDHLHTAQVLLTQGDLDKRNSYLNVRNTLFTLFEMGFIIPIINENDSTAVDQLRLGDNDTLSAKIAAKCNADLLIILSDIDGLYRGNPRVNPDAEFISHVEAITPEIEGYAGGIGSHTATGGMQTKLQAAKIAFAAGVPMVIANGHEKNIIQNVLSGKARCTTFMASTCAISHRKRWIAFGRTIHGVLVVDDGARDALRNQGTSLLPAGIIDAQGDFKVGDAVEIRDASQTPLARALVNYSCQEILRIKGKKTSAIQEILGHKDFDEVVHRDNLVLL